MRDNLSYYPYVAWFLDVVMNSNIDYEITKWEEMFYPAKLREYLVDFPQIDDSGNKLESTKLFSDTKEIVASKNTYASSGYYNWFFYLYLFFLLVLPFLLHVFYKKRCFFNFAVWFSRRWFLWSAFLGVIMSVAWGFSGHLDLHHNKNQNS